MAGESPIKPLLDALLNDRQYLLGWHANLATATMDALGDSLSDAERWDIGQEAARRFVAVLFSDTADEPEPITNAEVAGGVFSG